MAVSFRSYGQSPGATSTTCVVVKPTGLTVGDLMLAHIRFDNAQATTPPANWNELYDTGGSSLSWKYADAADVAAASFTFTSGAVDVANKGAISAYISVDGVGATNTSTGTGSSLTTTGVTPTIAGSMIVLLGDQKTKPVSTYSGYTLAVSSPAFTEEYDLSYSGASAATICMADGIRNETTATGTSTITASASNPWATYLVVLYEENSSSSSSSVGYSSSSSSSLSSESSSSSSSSSLSSLSSSSSSSSSLSSESSSSSSSLSSLSSSSSSSSSSLSSISSESSSSSSISSASSNSSSSSSLSSASSSSSSSISSFSTSSSSMSSGSGWLPGWEKRIKLKTDESKIDCDLTNFPILVHISNASGVNAKNITEIFSEIGSNNKKIAFTSSDGVTELYAEIDGILLEHRQHLRLGCGLKHILYREQNM